MQTALKPSPVAWFAVLLLLALVTTRAVAVAPTDELHAGEPDTIFSDPTLFDPTLSDSTLPSLDQPGGRIESAIQMVRDLQAEGGVYANALSGALVELGSAYRDAGEHESAMIAFTEALQVARVNHGLHDLRQLPYLHLMIAENASLGRWDQVGENYLYLYWIQKRNLGDKDPRLLPVIQEVVLAKLTIHDSASAMSVDFLEKSFGLLDDAVEIIELHYSDDIDRMADALYLIARFNYAIAAQTGRLVHHDAYRRASRQLGQGRGRGRGRTVIVEQEVDQALQLIARTERDGHNALRRVEKLYETRNPSRILSRALAIARQGDWQLLYRNGSGQRYYKRAYQLLARLEDGQDHTARLFGQPRRLPAMTSEPEAELAALPPGREDAEGEILEIEFEVTATGEPREIRERQVPTHLTDEARQLRRHIETWRFRPRMAGGDPVSTRVVQRLLITDNGEIIMLGTQSEPPVLADTRQWSP